jgi:hypothetical protein
MTEIKCSICGKYKKDHTPRNYSFISKDGEPAQVYAYFCDGGISESGLSGDLDKVYRPEIEG